MSSFRIQHSHGTMHCDLDRLSEVTNIMQNGSA